MNSENARASINSTLRLVIIMGLPISGKSYQLNKNYGGMYVIDSDDIKKLMRGHEDDHPEWTHERSKDIEKSLLIKAFERGQSFVWHTTGANTARVREVIADAHNHGYKVDLLYIKADNEACKIINRSKICQIPEHIIYKRAREIDATYEDIRPIVDNLLQNEIRQTN